MKLLNKAKEQLIRLIPPSIMMRLNNYFRHKRRQTVVYLTPFTPGYPAKKFFATGSPFGEAKKILEIHGYVVKLTDFKWIPLDADFIIFNNISTANKVMRNVKAFPQERMTSILWEPPVVLPKIYSKEICAYFGTVLTWKKDLLDNKQYLPFHYPNQLDLVHSDTAFENKKLCTMVNTDKQSKHKDELYSERRTIAHFFKENHSQEFDLFGYGWKKSEFPSYQRAIDNKLTTIAEYKFIFAYENNENIEGYITEKMVDALKAGCVPIYRGASNILEEIPQECFIDANQFHSYEELYHFLKTMNEITHKQYQAAAKQFIEEAQEGPFSIEFFAKTYAETVKRMKQLKEEN